jgi:hypothetical protein
VDRDAQFYRSIAKAPKMDFPRFDGTNPQEWLRTTEKYFAMVYVPEDAKFDYAQMYITGRADTWLRNSGVLEENLNWKQFCEVLVQRFTGNNSYEAVEQFNNIKQDTSTVSEYTDKFEDKMANYRKENPEVKQPYYIKCYINGLRGDIKHYLKPLKPTSLYEAVDYARDMELAMLANANGSNRRFNPGAYSNKSNFPGQNQHKPRTILEPATTKQDSTKPTGKPEIKFREPGVCKYCGQKWFFGHRCQQYKTLNLMATEENEDSSDDQTQEKETPEIDQTQPATSPTEAEQLMQISLQAIKGKSSKNTFTLSVMVGGKRAIALADTGSTHTFMDLKFSTKINCTTVSNSLAKVVVAGGGELHTGAHVDSLSYTIQGHNFQNSFKILPLKGYDIVLGGDWMLTHSPVKFDYEARRIKIKLNGSDKVYLKDESLTKGVQLMSLNKLQKALHKGATGYYLFPISATSTAQNTTDPAIPALLEEFSEVFAEPQELPPERTCDHAIPLKEGTSPPNIRPYRVPHKQKT